MGIPITGSKNNDVLLTITDVTKINKDFNLFLFFCLDVWIWMKLKVKKEYNDYE